MTFHSGGWWSYLRADEDEELPKVSRDLMARVLSYARPYVRQLAIVLATIVVISALTLVPPLLMRDLLDSAIPDENLGRVTLLGVGMILVPLLNGGFGVLQRWASSAAGEGIILDLRRQLFGHLQRMPLAFFTGTRTGELMSRLNNDVVGAQSAVTGTFITLASNIFTVAATMAVMLGIEWRLTLLAVAVLPLFWYPSRQVGNLLRRVSRDQMEHSAEMSATMNETLNVSGALAVKLFGRTRHEDERFGKEASEVARLGVKRATIGRWFFMALSLVSALGTAVVFWVGAVMVIDDTLTIGSIVALAAYLANLYGPLSALANARVEFATSLVSFERVFEVLDLPNTLTEKEDAVTLEHVVGSVVFDDVSFSYQEDAPTIESVRRRGRTPREVDYGPQEGDAEQRWAVSGVSLEVNPGELTALVGPSGAGKTTMTYLARRLHDPASGVVSLDGVDVRDLSFKTLAAAVGVVTQETYLFHETVVANLRYAKEDATPDEVEAASRAANIHEFITELPKGYDTVVGERGYRLSGGEKQRVAIARVILKDPKVLILDEATSHLDARSEALIQEALERLMKDRTSIVIAHRLSTILAADQIIVMDRGQIAERGTHSSLLDRGGLYSELYQTQFEASLAEPNP